MSHGNVLITERNLVMKHTNVLITERNLEMTHGDFLITGRNPGNVTWERDSSY